MDENTVTANSQTGLAPKSSRPKWPTIAIGVILVIVIIGVSGWISANAAASHYQKQRAAYLQTGQRVAAKAAGVDFSSLIVINGRETSAQYATEQQVCQTIQTLAKGQGQNPVKAPTLASNALVKILAPLSPSYRLAQHQQKSDPQVAGNIAAMYAHLQRLSVGCNAYVVNIGVYQPDLPNAVVRDSLIIKNGTHGQMCLHGDATCLPRYNAAAYKAAYGTLLAEDKDYIDYYATQCPYPELKSICAESEVLWKQDSVLRQQYYDNLPSGDYDTPSQELQTIDLQWNDDLAAALQKTQPGLVKAVGKDNVFTLATHLLMQQDEAAIHAAAKTIARDR